MNPKALFVLLLSAVLVAGMFSAGYGQEKPYPNRSIQLVVAHRPGGGNDLFFRLLGEELSKLWKVPVTIENQFAGGGTVAASAVATSKKDGTTFLGTLVGSLATMTAAKPDGPINLLRDFDPLMIDIGYSPAIYTVRADSKFKTLKEIVDYAKDKPGELISGQGPRGTAQYLQWELFKRMAKINIPTLNFAGGAEVVPQLLGGHIQIGGTSEVAAKPFVDSGKLRPFLIDIKSQIYPSLPTWADSGYPEVNLVEAINLLGPKDLPPTVIKAWENALGVILKDPKFLASFKKLGFNDNFQVGVEKNRAYLKDQVEKYSQFTPEELGWK